MVSRRLAPVRGAERPAASSLPAHLSTALSIAPLSIAPLSIAPLFIALFIALFAAWSAEAAAPAKRCDWHGPKSRGETTYKQCVDYAKMNGTTLDLPSNVTRISHDGISFCPGSFNGTTGAADIVYMMDNSGSMERGENSNGFDTPPGDPHGIRDRVIRRAMRQQRATADTATAAFISFFGLGGNQNYRTEPEIENNKTQRPIDISRINPQGEANLNTILRKVWKHNPNEASLQKPAAAAKLAKTALTFWSESLTLARNWFRPESAFVKTKNHAIVMVSDGAIGDWRDVEALIPFLPPVYGIHLGEDGNAQHLKNLCALTGGTFHLVSPNDTSAFAEVMERIIGVITKNPLPKSVEVVNRSKSPVQTSKSLEIIANPDGSLGVALDSIIGLKPGANQIELKVTRVDNQVTAWSFGLNVASPAITASSGTYSCYDQAKLSVIDSRGDTVEVYSPDATRQTVRLSRSPSELKGVNVAATADGGDKESLPLKVASGAQGYPIHTDEFKFNGKDASPTPGNGTVEVGNSGNVTLVWSHPRDPFETSTYFLLGKKIPVVNAIVDVRIRKEVVRGVDLPAPAIRIDNPVVIVDKGNRCISNCAGSQTLIDNKEGVPGWSATIRSPVKLSMSIYDNLGQFVNESSLEVTAAQWEAMQKSGDSAAVEILLRPVAYNGAILGTGAYLMKMDIKPMGGPMRRGSDGELVEVRAKRQEYFKRFGYVRN